MQTRNFGRIGQISALTLGGGGVGNVWGCTTRQEAVATLREAVADGITFIDLAPSYGDGEAESVMGQAFHGVLPAGLRISTKYRLGNPSKGVSIRLLEDSLDKSLSRMNLERIDLFFLHGQIIQDQDVDRYEGTSRALFTEVVRPWFEKMVSSGKIGDWGITGIGEPSTIIQTIKDSPSPAAVQVITNLLDSPGSMRKFQGSARPRDIIAAANNAGVAVMGIRAVQAGALTDAFDREIPDDHIDMCDYRLAEPFRNIAKGLGESTTSLAHRYALSMSGISTIVLGVKNRMELRECIAAEALGPLNEDIIRRIDEGILKA